MKNLKEVLENNEEFTLSEYDKIVYNAQDHENHKRGKNAKGKNVFHRIYSVYAVNLRENIAFVQSRDVWSGIWDETIQLTQLAKYDKTNL